METPKKPVMKMIMRKEISSKDRSYVIRPRTLFRSPLSHIQSDQFKIRDQKMIEITTHCNYGFNYDTIKCYASFLDRLVRAHEISGSQKDYQSNYDLFRLNDGIPLEFGGFSPCLNKHLLDISSADDFSNGNSLFQYLIEICCNMASYDSLPLLQFVRSIYNKGDLKTIVQAIKANLENYFQQSMEIIRDRNRQLGIQVQKIGIGLDPYFGEASENLYQVLFANLTLKQGPNKSKVRFDEQPEQNSKGSLTNSNQPFSIGKRTTQGDQMEIQDEEFSKAILDDHKMVIIKKGIKPKIEQQIRGDQSEPEDWSSIQSIPKKTQKKTKKHKKNKINKKKHKKEHKRQENKKNKQKHKKDKKKSSHRSYH